jgi:hypothetical protein
MRFSQYSGSRRTWPTSRESIAETSFALPVYRSWPDRPFDVLGSLRFENPRQYWDDGVIHAAVSEAKHRGGNAIIIRQGTEEAVSGTIGSGEDPMVWSQNQTTALVIKWKPQGVIIQEASKVQAFKERFRSEHPELCRNASLIDLATDYFLAKGFDLDSRSTSDEFRSLVTDLQGTKDGELSGKWLYQCGFRQSRLTSSWSQSFFGVAAVTLKGDVLAIVSIDRGTEVSFSGAYDKGRLNGKMGIATVSLNCDGAATQEKISLSGQGQSADGVCQASLVLQR